MNNEPSEFLPIRKDWLKPKKSDDLTVATCLGIAIGAALAVATAWLIVTITNHL